jgi:DNA-binding CsgD family transcriptional regulator
MVVLPYLQSRGALGVSGPVSAGETFGACGCPVTTAGVLHNVPCSFGGARARAYVRADALQQANDQPQCVFPVVRDFGLTRRQTEAAHLLGRGATNKEIAQAMGVNMAGARKLMAAIMLKTRATNRTMAAMRLGGLLTA